MYGCYTFVKRNFMKHVLTIIFSLFVFVGYSQKKTNLNSLRYMTEDETLKLDTVDFKALHAKLTKEIKIKQNKTELINLPTKYDITIVRAINWKDGTVYEYEIVRPQDITPCFALSPWFILPPFYSR